MTLSRSGRAPLLLLLLAVALASLSSCSVGTDPGPCETFECREISYLLTAYRTVYESAPDSVSDHVSLGAVLAPFTLIHGSASYTGGVNGGTVTFNDAELIANDADSAGVRYALQLSNDSLLAPPGSTNIWKVSGWSSLVPEFEAGIVTPPTLRTNQVPSAPNDTIDTEADFLITWNSGSATDSTFDFILVVGEGKDGGFQILSSINFFGRDTVTGQAYRIPSDSLRAWRERMTGISIQVERETIHDVFIPSESSTLRDGWARLLIREAINRSFFFRP